MIKNPLTGKMIKASGSTAKQLLENTGIQLPKSVTRAIQTAIKQKKQVGGVIDDDGVSCHTSLTVENITNAMLNAQIIPINKANETISISIVDAILQLPDDLIKTIGTDAAQNTFSLRIKDIRNFSALLVTDMVKTVNHYKQIKQDVSTIVEYLKQQQISLDDCKTNTCLKYLVSFDFFTENMRTFWDKEDEMLLSGDAEKFRSMSAENKSYVQEWENAWIVAALKSRDDHNSYDPRFIKTMNKSLVRFNRRVYKTTATTLGELVAFYESISLPDKILIGI